MGELKQVHGGQGNGQLTDMNEDEIPLASAPKCTLPHASDFLGEERVTAP